jgi:rubrerythrin
MSDLAEKIEVIELMAKHEEAIAGLYVAFSEKFPECEIWPYLYGEEMKHSEWLRSILDNVYEGSVKFTDYHLTNKSLSISIRNIESNTEKAGEGKFELEEALGIAFTMENSLIEDHYLDYFTSDNEGIVKVLEDLKKDTLVHRKLLKEKKEEYILEKRNRNWQV